MSQGADPLARVRRNALRYHGAAGARWLVRLDEVTASARAALSLDALDAPFPDLSINLVAPGRWRGRDVVLKLCCDPREYALERDALAAAPPGACAEVLAHDDAHHALLLERVSPGDPLDGRDDATSLAAALDLMERLHARAPAGHGFPTVRRWCQGLARHRAAFGGAGPLPRDLFDAAESLAADLLAEATDGGWLLHGDLHHANVLRDASRGWIAIDPKGVVGPRAYELCAWMRNPPGFATTREAAARLARRVDQAAERAWVDRDVLVAWGLVEAVLSESWDVEEGQTAPADVPMARLYRALI